MAWRGQIGGHERLLLVAGAVLVAAVGLVVWWQNSGGNSRIAVFDAIASAPFILAVALALYRPAVIVAFAALLLKIVVLIDTAETNIAPPHTGNFLTDIMVAGAEGAAAGGRIAMLEVLFTVAGICLLVFVIAQRLAARRRQIA